MAMGWAGGWIGRWIGAIKPSNDMMFMPQSSAVLFMSLLLGTLRFIDGRFQSCGIMVAVFFFVAVLAELRPSL